MAPTYSLNNPGQPDYRMPASDAPVATGGKVQPRSPHGPKLKKPKKVSVKKPKSNGGVKAPALDPTQKALLDAAVKLRYGGQEQALGQQLQGAQRFASGLPTWYSQAIQQIKSQQAPVAPVQAPAPTGDPAQDSRANLNAAFSQQMAQRQGAQNDFLTNVGAGLQVQQGNTLNQNALLQNQIRGQQTQLAGDKGAYKTQLVADQQAAAAKADLEDKKLQASLAIAGGKINLARDILNQVTKPKTQATIKQGNARVKNDSARVRNDRARIRETKQQHAVDNQLKVNKLALDAYMKAHPELSKKGGTKGQSFTPTQVRSAQKKFRTIHGSLKPEYVKQHPELSIRRIIKEKGVDPLMARAIVQTIAGGGVDRKTATAFYRAYGFHLKVNDLGEKTVGNVIKFFQQ